MLNKNENLLIKGKFLNGFITFLSVFVFFCLINNAKAETYYIDNTDGLDTNSGTSTVAAWKTVTKANTAMSTAVIKAGDLVLFKRGETFTGYINVTVSGTPGNYLSFGTYGTGAKPIINASSLSYGINARNGLEYVSFEDLDVRDSTNSSVFLFNTVNNFIFTNIETSGAGSAFKIQTGDFSNITLNGVSSTGYATAGINLAGTSYSNIFVENSNFNATGTNGYLTGVGTYSNLKILTSTFQNHTSHGIYFSAGNIDGLEIRGGETSYNTGAGLYMYQSSTNILIKNYSAKYNISNGLYIYSNSNKVISNITIEDSTFTNNSSGLAFNWVGNNARINHVTSSDNNVDGFNVHGTWTDMIFDRCIAENNGVFGYSGAGDGYSFHDSSSGTIRYSIARNNYKTAIAHVNSSSVYMEYNIFSHTTNGTLPLVYVDGDGYHYLYNNVLYSPANTGTAMQINGSTVDIKNNIIYGFDNGILQTAGTTTEDYNLVFNTVSSSWSGLARGAHSISLNPLFVSSSLLDFSLQANSPAIDAGLNRGDEHKMAILSGSVWPFAVLTSDQNGRGNSWDIGAYLGPVQPAPVVVSTPLSSGGGGMPTGYSEKPTPPIEGFKIEINHNEIATNDTAVVLSLHGGPNTVMMSISNYSDFRNAIQEKYQSQKNWNICESSNCQPGVYSVYVKYFSSFGVASENYSDQIRLQTQRIQVISSNSSIVNKAEIDKSSLNTSKINITTFKSNLRPGQKGKEVIKLQTFLKSLGKSIYPEARINGKYDYPTIKAIKRFQVKNKIKSNGLFGPATRSKANAQISV